MKLLLFGASGTVGGAVLQACVNMPIVTEVRVVVRRPLGRSNAKLREFVHTNYSDYAGVTEAFRGVDACLFCLGVSAALRPVLRLLKPFPSLYVSGEDLGRAMVEATKQNLRRRVIENAGIRTLARQGEGT
jgi:hypothetical protein